MTEYSKYKFLEVLNVLHCLRIVLEEAFKIKVMDLDDKPSVLGLHPLSLLSVS